MTFKDFNINIQLIKALEDLGFTEPTTIQQKIFSPVMAGKNILGISQTGTGKTVAYLLPLLRLWKFQKKVVPEIIIIVPTRELVVQVVEETQKLSQYTDIKVTGIYGGANMKPQIAAIKAGVDIIVATPGRLLDLFSNETIQPKFIKKLVLDEVDEMLNLGFRTQLKNILSILPEKRQNLLFSATVTEEVVTFLENNYIHYERIEAAPAGTPHANISQVVYRVPNFNTKINFLKYMLSTDSSMKKVLIFAGGKQLADDVNKEMEQQYADRLAVIHSNKTQNNRFKTVRQFENGESTLLIASDVVARGLDISSVSHVINMDVPEAPESYIHRIGRTGRAEQKGIAITFVTEADMDNKTKVEELMGYEIPTKELPSEVEISTELRDDELPKIKMKIIEVRQPKVEPKGPSHHEKSAKNQKTIVKVKIARIDKLKKKYGKSYRKEHRD